MSDAPLLIEVSGATATLTLNRPRVGNAIDLVTARALMDAAVRCDTDESIRCAVLTAVGRLFVVAVTSGRSPRPVTACQAC